MYVLLQIQAFQHGKLQQMERQDLHVYSLYFDFHRITSSSRSSGDGKVIIVYFTLDEKLNLHCIYYISGGVKVLVNMVYVASIP